MDAFEDIDINNSYLMSESHFGTLKLQEIMKMDEDEKTNSLSIKFESLAGMSSNYCYDLTGIVVHYGSGMHYGHYWSLAKSNGPIGSQNRNSKWIEFDD